jgi:ABC-type transporter Mla maintaining outer membrane lipid asymmetry permease subunit MlaE
MFNNGKRTILMLRWENPIRLVVFQRLITVYMYILYIGKLTIQSLVGTHVVLDCKWIISGVTSPMFWSRYTNFNSLSLFISLEIDCVDNL